MKTKLMIVGVVAVVLAGAVFTSQCFARSGGPRRCGSLSGAPFSSFGAGGIGHGEKLMRLVYELDLTQEQQNQVRDILKVRSSQAIDIMWPLAQARQDLKRTCLGDDVDEKTIRSAADRLGHAIAEVAVFKSKLCQEIKQVLTEQQIEQFKELCARRGGRLNIHHRDQ